MATKQSLKDTEPAKAGTTTEPAKAGTTNAEPAASSIQHPASSIQPGVRKLTLNEARALHAAKHLTGA